MKRYNGLFDKIVDIENIKRAHQQARRGKTHYREVKMVDADADHYACLIQQMLINEAYQVGAYCVMERTVDSGKVRQIYRLDYYPHRIIHHAIIQVLESIWTRTLVSDTYCCVKGRGIHKAAAKIKRILRTDRVNAAFCLKLDINKYYPSIDNGIMKHVVRRKIKDQKCLRLLDKVIDSAEGLPIGNYLSQYFANLYLSAFDHYCKEVLRANHYFRYCDDIVILSSSKGYLHDAYQKIKSYLNNIGLTPKDNWQVFPVADRGVDFLGYRFYPGYTLLRKRIAKRALRLSAMIVKKDYLTTAQFRSVVSYIGWLKHCNSLNLRKKVYNENVFRLISCYTKDRGIKNPLQGRV